MMNSITYNDNNKASKYIKLFDVIFFMYCNVSTYKYV